MNEAAQEKDNVGQELVTLNVVPAEVKSLETLPFLLVYDEFDTRDLAFRAYLTSNELNFHQTEVRKMVTSRLRGMGFTNIYVTQQARDYMEHHPESTHSFKQFQEASHYSLMTSGGRIRVVQLP